MLLADHYKVLVSFKMEQEADFKNSTILPTTFNQLDFPIKLKYTTNGALKVLAPTHMDT